MLRNTWGWGGWVGWGVMTSLKLHTCWMLRNTWGWGGWVGWGVMTSLKLHTCWMLRNTWGWGGWVGGVGCNDIVECFTVIGGDNATESEVARTKSQLRRTNALGRQSPATSHVDQVAARRLLKRPGLVTVMQSMATYRAARVNALGHSPANFLNLNNDSSWLYA